MILRTLALAVLGLSLVPQPCPGAAFDAEISAFEAEDAANPPAHNAILFVGSSTIRIWPDLPAKFPPHAVLNRGFGGSHMSDVLYYFDRVVAPYAPALVVVYEGDNDLASGKTVSQVYADYTNFLFRVQRDLPGTDVAFMSVKPSPSRAQYRTQMEELNHRLSALSDGRRIRYIDVFTPLLNSSNQPRPELFQSDLLHLNAAGYAVLESVVGPALNQWILSRGFSVLLDFGAATTPTQQGPTPNDPENHWNNITPEVGTSSGGVLSNLVTSANRPSGIGLAMHNRFNGANENGISAETVYPASAVRDSLYGNTEPFNGASNVYPAFKLTGLDPSMSYSFQFFASRMNVGDNRETAYSVSGSNSGYTTLDAANNVTNFAWIHGIAPDPSGEILVNLSPTTNNNNANHFTYLGVLRIEAIPPQTPIGFIRQPTNLVAIAFQPATFSAAVTGTPPFFVQWRMNGAPIPGATSLVCSIPEVTPGLDGVAFSVTVSNLLYGAVSSDALLSVLADTNPPVLVTASTLDGMHFELAFSEQLLATSVTASNLTVNGLVPASVIPGPNQTNVLLTLSEVISGPFTVKVHGIEDRSGNPGSGEFAGTVPEAGTEGFLIDFGGTSTTQHGPAPDDPDFYWNNITEAIATSATGLLPNLVTTRNAPSNASLVMIRRFNGANLNGTTSSGLFPADATRDSLFGNTESFNGLTSVFPSFRLTGLIPGQAYDLVFYASRTGVSDNRETAYTIVAAETNVVTLNAANNVTNVAVASSITANLAGTIQVSLAPGPRNNNANHFTYLGVLKVMPAIPLRFQAPTISAGTIRLNWTGAGKLEWAPAPDGPWTAIAPHPQPPYFETVSENGSRFYRLRR